MSLVLNKICLIGWMWTDLFNRVIVWKMYLFMYMFDFTVGQQLLRGRAGRGVAGVKCWQRSQCYVRVFMSGSDFHKLHYSPPPTPHTRALADSISVLIWNLASLRILSTLTAGRCLGLILKVLPQQSWKSFINCNATPAALLSWSPMPL